eukprot:Blabericola_migrator_1__732@NODE_1182_length_5200_cov_33_557763_g804_i0_p3_GENE_NODE_1182_length_5200_cov_33_557763_g804_i0NODE_1182_length_5200_cov_33_557763_g804_i0_p3_ORF_typecomplete_len122_score0_92VMA21/PF09446_10/0_12_NODE_1182_length_5200_cov_33_557763_g804_i011561521
MDLYSRFPLQRVKNLYIGWTNNIQPIYRLFTQCLIHDYYVHGVCQQFGHCQSHPQSNGISKGFHQSSIEAVVFIYSVPIGIRYYTKHYNIPWYSKSSNTSTTISGEEITSKCFHQNVFHTR